MDIENISILDIIDKHTLQSLQDSFADATGMAALATDKNGAITNGSNFTDFCMNLTRASRKGCERCNQCDLKGGEESSRTGRPSVYYCHAGLCDFAAPIMFNGKHIGSLIGGQVLPEPPDEQKFRKIAIEIGVDPDEYIAALRKVKIVPKKQIDAAAQLLYLTANALSDAAYQRLMSETKADQEKGTVAFINSRFDELNDQIVKTSQSVQALSDNFSAIKESAASSAKAVENTDGIVKAIENSSTQLTLIGFNASIEAKRAGAAGTGFNVIAQEVRTLAERNTKQAGEIGLKLGGIKKAMNDINDQIKDVNESVSKNAAEIDALRDMLSEVGNTLNSEME